MRVAVVSDIHGNRQAFEAVLDDVEVVTDSPFFTCAAQPAEALGRTAVERLIGRLRGDESPLRETVLQSELRIRRSCGCS